MEFHPFEIELLKIRKKGNDLVFCEKENDIDRYTISLISYRTSRLRLHLGTDKLYVGDIYYIEDINKFVIFSLIKEEASSQGIQSCRFGILESNYGQNNYMISEYLTIDKFLLQSISRIKYVGNIFVHEEINDLFNKYNKNSNNDNPLYFLQKDTDDEQSDFYRNNFEFLVIYQMEKDMEVLEYYHLFKQLDVRECLAIKKTNWRIVLTTKVNYYTTKSTYVKHVQKRKESFLLICRSGDLFKLKDSINILNVQEDIAKNKQDSRQFIESYFDYYKAFFVVFDGYRGEVRYISPTNNIDRLIDSMQRPLFHPLDNDIYDQIEANTNDLTYAKYIIEMI